VRHQKAEYVIQDLEASESYRRWVSRFGHGHRELGFKVIPVDRAFSHLRQGFNVPVLDRALRVELAANREIHQCDDGLDHGPGVFCLRISPNPCVYECIQLSPTYWISDLNASRFSREV